MARIKIIAAIIAIGLAGAAAYTLDVIPSASAQQQQILSAPEAYDLAASGEVTLIDIRTPREWAQTGVGKGAVPINMRSRDFLDQLIAQVDGDPNAPIALICATGGRSARLSAALAGVGFTNIIDVPEGMMGSRAGPGWLARGLPVVKQ